MAKKGLGSLGEYLRQHPSDASGRRQHCLCVLMLHECSGEKFRAIRGIPLSSQRWQLFKKTLSVEMAGESIRNHPRGVPAITLF